MSELAVTESVARVLNALTDNACGYDHSLVLSAACFCRNAGQIDLADRLSRLDRLGRAALRGEVVTEVEMP